MKLGKIFKLFKKGSKAASSAKKKGGVPSKWPSGIRIGVYGHSNSGKTVYYTVLNEDCKVSRKLQIAVSDTSTAGEFLNNYRSIWGVGTTTDVGTMVDLRGEKKFPDPTEGDKLLQFSAIIDRDDKVSVVSLDYDGKAVAITGASDNKERVVDFMAGADGLLIFYDPKMLGAELQTQEHVASFTNVLESLAPLNRRLPIPVALVVTKADILPGFTGENETVLVSPEDENFFSNDYEIFLEKVLTSNRIAANSVWAGTVRDILVKLKEFVKVVVGRTLDFQIFFTSTTGATPEKIGTDVGRSIYAPPDKMHPIGVKEPFYWLLKSVLKNRGLNRMRKVTKWATYLSLLWIGIFSLPYLLNFAYLLPGVYGEEDAILQAHYDRTGTTAGLPQSEITKITSRYRSYENNWVVDWLFPEYRRTARQVQVNYRNLEAVDIKGVLDRYVAGFRRIAADSSRWPIRKVDEATFVENDNSVQFNGVLEDIDSLRIGDNETQLLDRRERIQWFMGKFRDAILTPEQSGEIRGFIRDRIARLEEDEDIVLSSAEKDLFEELKKREEAKVVVETARKTGSDIEAYLATINSNDDVEFRLETAPRKLQSELPTLQADAASNREVIGKINKYLEGVQRFKTRRQYVYRLSACPDNYHVHVMVKRGSADTDWRTGKALYAGVNADTITWRMGDDIVLALDPDQHQESWGKNSAVKKELKGKFALFDMQKSITVGSHTLSFSFEADLAELLPEVD